MGEGKGLLEKAKSLPNAPGCYLMQAKGKILYVGKAKGLRQRVCSYFKEVPQGVKNQYLVQKIDDFEFILTHTEAEALILEDILIKKHRPKYNIRLKDDKSYPHLVINQNEPFPRPLIKRRPQKGKGIKIFGPFTGAYDLNAIVKWLIKVMELRDCSLHEFKNRKRPCLLYQMGQCSAPCVGKISEEAYEKKLALVIAFFSAKHHQTLAFFQKKMQGHAEAEEFELAAQLRDAYFLLEGFVKKQVMEEKLFGKNLAIDIDLISYKRTYQEVDIGVYLIRQGVLIGQKNFFFQSEAANEEGLEDELVSLLYRYYLDEPLPPKWFFIDGLEEKKHKILEEALREKYSHLDFTFKAKEYETKFEKVILLLRQFVQELKKQREAEGKLKEEALAALKRFVGLKGLPRLIECYDIAIFAGSSPTASKIVFKDGGPLKTHYRHYKLKQRPEGNNDFAMMEEVLSRRLKKGELPDLLIVDGGKGQISSAKKAMAQTGKDCPVVGLAKAKKGKKRGQNPDSAFERLILPCGKTLNILPSWPLFKLLVQMRDEAHRFSRRLHHKLEKKRSLHSWIDAIRGIGPATKKQILKNLEYNVEEVAKFDRLKMQEVFGISNQKAQLMVDHFEDIFVGSHEAKREEQRKDKKGEKKS